MNGTLQCVTRPGAGTIALAATALLAAGCGKRRLRQGQRPGHHPRSTSRPWSAPPARVPGAPPAARVNAGRYVLTTDRQEGCHGRGLQAERQPHRRRCAAALRRPEKILEQQMPGKAFEAAMKEQGTTPEEIKEEMRAHCRDEPAAGQEDEHHGRRDQKRRTSRPSTKGQMGLPNGRTSPGGRGARGRQRVQQAQKMLADKHRLPGGRPPDEPRAP